MSEPMRGQFRRELEEIINRNGIDTFLSAPAPAPAPASLYQDAPESSPAVAQALCPNEKLCGGGEQSETQPM